MKNRCLLIVALLVTMLSSAHRVMADNSVTIDGITYTYDWSNAAYVSNAVDTITHAKVLSGVTINGMVYPVTRIGSNAFSSMTSSLLQTVELPNTITQIQSYAFQNCNNLTTINIPDEVKEIDFWAFYGCSSLTSINIPSGVTEIKNGTFSHCSSLKSVTLPSNLTTIEQSAFNGCSSLTSINIPSGVTEIGTYAFENCSSLPAVTIPEGITTLSNSIFYYCSSLKSVTLPKDLLTIGNSAFAGCSSLDSINIPTNVSIIGESAFENCSKLASINIPNGVKAIENNTFKGCSSLTSLVIPSGVTTIGRYAFQETGLFTMEIPANVTSIGYGAFPSSLARLTCLGTTPPALGQDEWNNNTYDLGNISVVYVPNGSGANYKSIDPWASKVIVDGSGVAVTVTVPTPGMMGEEILNQTNYLSNVNFLTVSGSLNNADIENIRNSMPNLLTIDMSGVDMTNLPTDMFNNRKALLSIILPKSLQTIGQGTFYNCINLESIVLPEGLTTIYDGAEYSYSYGAFSNCISLKSVSFPSTLTTIGSYAFEGCRLLDNVELKDGLIHIGKGAFQYCYSLKSITLPRGLNSISDKAFAYCNALKQIVLPEGLTSIGGYFYDSDHNYSDGAFQSCTSLEKVVLPTTLQQIGNGTFYGCTKLKDVTFAEGLAYIGQMAFYNCDGLEEIELPATLKRCGKTPFGGCDNLADVTSLSLLPAVLSDGLLSVDDMGLAIKRTLYVPEWTLNKYKLTSGWAAFAEILPIATLYPQTINVDQEVTLSMPTGGLPAGYKPDLSIEQGYNSSTAGNLYLKGTGDVSLGMFKMYQHKYDDNYNYSDNYSYWDNSTVFLNEPNVTADSVMTSLSFSSGIWYFLSFPYDVKVSDIVTNGDWVIRYYDGAARAKMDYNNTWVTVPYDSVLHAGQGYIWSSSNGSFTVPAVDNANKNLMFATTTRNVPLVEYASEHTSNSSWNLIGNPFPSYFDTRFMEYTAPITVWDRKNRTYVAYSPVDDSYILSPLEAFFVQCPAGVTQTEFKAEGRQTNNAVRSITTPVTVTTRSAIASREVFNMQLSDGQRSDRTRFVINDNAQMVYEVGCDAAKFMSTDAKAPQLFTLVGEDKMAINERPMADGRVALGMYFGVAGTYTLSLESSTDTKIILIDHFTGIERDITMGEYTFETETGTFADRFTVVLTRTGVTSVNEMAIDNQVKVLPVAGGINVTATEGADVLLYNVAGAQVAVANGSSVNFNVAPGLYVVKVGDDSFKVSVSK